MDLRIGMRFHISVFLQHIFIQLQVQLELQDLQVLLDQQEPLAIQEQLEQRGPRVIQEQRVQLARLVPRAILALLVPRVLLDRRVQLARLE